MLTDKKYDWYYSRSIYYMEITESNRQWNSTIFNWWYIVEITEEWKSETKRRNKIAIKIGIIRITWT